MLQILSFCIFFILFNSCSSVRKSGLSFATPLINSASDNILNIKNYNDVKKSLPANLMLMQSFASLVPDDTNLNLTLLKGYVALAFAIDETQLLRDRLSDKYQELNSSNNYIQAVSHYKTALDFGERYLQVYDLSLLQLEKYTNKGVLQQELDKKLNKNKDNLEAIFFIAQAFVSLINLQKDKIEYVAKLLVTKGLFDWVCNENPNFYNGACQIFYGGYLASRPKMLGGDPLRAKNIFENAIDKWPHNYLIREAFMEYYIIPFEDKPSYITQNLNMHKFQNIFKKSQEQLYFERKNNTITEHDIKNVNLYNAIALKRLNIINKFESDLF